MESDRLILDNLAVVGQNQKVEEWVIPADAFNTSEDSGHNTGDNTSSASDHHIEDNNFVTNSDSSGSRSTSKYYSTISCSNKTTVKAVMVKNSEPAVHKKPKHPLRNASVKTLSNAPVKSSNNNSKLNPGNRQAKNNKNDCDVTANVTKKMPAGDNNKKVSDYSDTNGNNYKNISLTRSRSFNTKSSTGVEKSLNLSRSNSIRKNKTGPTGATVFDRLYSSPQRRTPRIDQLHHSVSRKSSADTVGTSNDSEESHNIHNVSRNRSREISPAVESDSSSYIAAPCQSNLTYKNKIISPANAVKKSKVEPEKASVKKSTPAFSRNTTNSKTVIDKPSSKDSIRNPSKKTSSPWAKASDRFSSSGASKNTTPKREHAMDLESKEVLRPKFERFKATRSSTRDAFRSTVVLKKPKPFSGVHKSSDKENKDKTPAILEKDNEEKKSITRTNQEGTGSKNVQTPNEKTKASGSKTSKKEVVDLKADSRVASNKSQSFVKVKNNQNNTQTGTTVKAKRSALSKERKVDASKVKKFAGAEVCNTDNQNEKVPTLTHWSTRENVNKEEIPQDFDSEPSEKDYDHYNQNKDFDPSDGDVDVNEQNQHFNPVEKQSVESSNKSYAKSPSAFVKEVQQFSYAMEDLVAESTAKVDEMDLLQNKQTEVVNNNSRQSDRSKKLLEKLSRSKELTASQHNSSFEKDSEDGRIKSRTSSFSEKFLGKHKRNSEKESSNLPSDYVSESEESVTSNIKDTISHSNSEVFDSNIVNATSNIKGSSSLNTERQKSLHSTLETKQFAFDQENESNDLRDTNRTRGNLAERWLSKNHVCDVSVIKSTKPNTSTLNKPIKNTSSGSNVSDLWLSKLKPASSSDSYGRNKTKNKDITVGQNTGHLSGKINLFEAQIAEQSLNSNYKADKNVLSSSSSYNRDYQKPFQDLKTPKSDYRLESRSRNDTVSYVQSDPSVNTEVSKDTTNKSLPFISNDNGRPEKKIPPPVPKKTFKHLSDKTIEGKVLSDSGDESVQSISKTQDVPFYEQQTVRGKYQLDYRKQSSVENDGSIPESLDSEYYDTNKNRVKGLSNQKEHLNSYSGSDKNTRIRDVSGFEGTLNQQDVEVKNTDSCNESLSEQNLNDVHSYGDDDITRKSSTEDIPICDTSRSDETFRKKTVSEVTECRSDELLHREGFDTTSVTPLATGVKPKDNFKSNIGSMSSKNSSINKFNSTEDIFNQLIGSNTNKKSDNTLPNDNDDTEDLEFLSSISSMVKSAILEKTAGQLKNPPGRKPLRKAHTQHEFRYEDIQQAQNMVNMDKNRYSNPRALKNSKSFNDQGTAVEKHRRFQRKSQSMDAGEHFDIYKSKGDNKVVLSDSEEEISIFKSDTASDQSADEESHFKSDGIFKVRKTPPQERKINQFIYKSKASALLETLNESSATDAKPKSSRLTKRRDSSDIGRRINMRYGILDDFAYPDPLTEDIGCKADNAEPRNVSLRRNSSGEVGKRIHMKLKYLGRYKDDEGDDNEDGDADDSRFNQRT